MTNPVHLLTAAYYPSSVWTGTQRVKLQMRGSVISVYIDTGGGYPVTPNISITDTDVPLAGKAGLYLSNTAGYGLDNYSAKNSDASSFVTDTFVGTNGTTLASHTGSLGATWTVHPTLGNGTAAIQSNAVQLSGGDQIYYYASGSPSNADYDVESDITYLSGNAAAGVAGRLSSSGSTGYLAFYYNVSGGTVVWALGKWVAGVYTTIATIPAPEGAVGIAAYTYEWRDLTPENPVTPTNPALYSTAPTMQQYGNVYGSGPSKRIGILNGIPYDFNDGKAGTQRFGSITWDAVGAKLYWTFGETYSLDATTQYLGYSELNYSTGASTPHGAWATSGTEYKGGLTGVLNIPSSFVTAAGLGTKRLATIGSPPASVQATGDVSPGPQLCAFTPPVGVTEQTTITSQRLVGYAPFTNDPGPGQSRAIRPASIQWYQGSGSAAVIPFSNWPDTYWNGYDIVVGGVWIHGTSKSGFITVNQLYKGQVTYLHATVVPQMLVNALSIMSEADLLEVALGTKQPYEVQPVTTELTFPVLDPADYTSVQAATISTITTPAGTRRSVGALLTTTSPHPFGVAGATGVIGVIGNSNIEYNDNWDFVVINSTQIQISNPSLDSYTFTGASGSGGGLWYIGYGLYPGTGIRILGLQYDETSKQMYLGFVTKDLAPMVAVWEVLCD